MSITVVKFIFQNQKYLSLCTKDLNFMLFVCVQSLIKFCGCVIKCFASIGTGQDSLKMLLT